jgi:AcrR family transcriptional regulator
VSTGLDVASRDGLQALSIGEMARVLEMPKSGVASEFPSTDHLQLAVLEEAHAREAELTQAISAVTAGALSEKEGEYNSLRLELESKRSIQKILTDRMQELDVTSQLKENNVRVVDVAEAKDDPVEPNYARNIGVAILAGLLAGVSLALFFDYMDTTIKTREEVEALGIPFLGIIPSVPGLAGDGWEVARERCARTRAGCCTSARWSAPSCRRP